MTSILVADDHEVVRSGLRALLNGREDWQVVAEAADGKQAVAQAVATVPDVAKASRDAPSPRGRRCQQGLTQCLRSRGRSGSAVRAPR
jgi:DNA-binding NarL/FixJ family response regulator